MKKVLIKGLALAFVGSLAMAGSASALSVSLNDGSLSTDILVQDVDGDGIVSYAGNVGYWDVTMTSGWSAPTLGSETRPVLDLLSMDVNYTGSIADSLTVKIQDDYTGPLDASVRGFLTSIGGTSNGLDVDLYVKITDSLGSEYNGSILWDDMDSFTGDAFAGSSLWSDLSGYDFSGAYSIEMLANIQGLGFASFDASTTAPVPEPATMLLFGSGLVGLAGYGRKKIVKK